MKLGYKLTGIFLIFTLSITVFFYVIELRGQKILFKTTALEHINNIESSFEILEERDTKILFSALEVIIHDPVLKEVYLGKNRGDLYDYAQLLFQKLKNKHGITHFYFILPDGRVFLRMHEKNIYGDSVERTSFQKARDTQGPAWEIELGKTAFALRAVMPYYNDGKLIGYVELGEGIPHLLNILKRETSNEFGIIADKKYLDRDDWKSTRRVAGLRDNWDDIEKHIVISSTSEGEMAGRCFVDDNMERVEDGEHIFQRIKSNNTTYMCSGFDLSDASGRHIGALLSLSDITGHIAIAQKANGAILRMAIILFLVIFATTILISRSITKPLLKLVEAAKAIGRGDLEQHVSITSTDEIGQLAGAFNQMAEDLEASTVKRDELAKEITERKKIEFELIDSLERYSSLFHSSNDSVFIHDTEGNILDINNKGLEQFGYTKSDISSIKLPDLHPPTALEASKKAFKGILQNNHTNFEIDFKKKNGEIFSAEVSSSIFEVKGKKLIQGIVRDITERKKLQAQLLQAQKMETVGQLAGGVAHDFNNILGAIMNYGYILRNKLANEEHKEILEHILDSTDKATRLTSDLLAFSRKQILKTAPVKLNEIIKKVEKLISRIIVEHIEIKTILTENNPVVVADSGQIEQVLMNLLTNAQDAMSEGGVLTIETGDMEIDDEYIRAHGYGEPGKFALLSITDTGAGMDKETREKIFEPFYTTKEVGKGTGLGLAMVYGIIKQHNGYINVYSEPGKGTTFKIYLPVTGEESVEGRPSVSETMTKGTETVLLAEDNGELRIATKQILEEHGYKVIEAVDGEDAIGKFKENKNRIELLLFDVVMPKKSGKKVYDEIRKGSPDIKVLFMSGYTEGSIVNNGVLKEGLNYISKPVVPKKLLKKIREVLSK